MGGGVGCSQHASIRICTENTVWAMPETSIGFFTDVGASYFLNVKVKSGLMRPAVARFLALTGQRLKCCELM